MRIILATNNKNKLREISQILSPLGYEVVTQSDAGINIEVDETGVTFAENAYLKAKAIFDLTDNCCVLADDSGLMIDYLNGEPGVYSARYGGTKNDKDHNDLVLKKLSGVPDEKRTARFVCAMCFIKADGEVIAVEGKCEGKIAAEPSGENGFGYDPIFMFGDKSFAEIPADEKNRVSHRANAIKMLLQSLNTN
ncbi:MAG: RdgB/HAM1 family non-canonical purine NTP pyrophosphatase [Ruminococcus sp.]|nr:RdgB/HAM1 family non-canonical purine NTP pyrophosphatase [Ruminococcus sp.]